MRFWKDVVLVVAVVFLAGFLWRALGQEKVKPITDAEKIAVLQAQKDALQAQAALQATPEWQRFQAAQAGLQKAAQEIYSSRKITNAEYVLCDGPGAGECKDVKAGVLELKAVEKKK